MDLVKAIQRGNCLKHPGNEVQCLLKYCLFIYLFTTVHGTQVQKVEINSNKSRRDVKVKKEGMQKTCRLFTR